MSDRDVTDRGTAQGEQSARRKSGRFLAGSDRSRKRTSKYVERLIPPVDDWNVWDRDYGVPVLQGKILVGKFVFLAVQRHYADLQEGAARGLSFSPKHAWHVITFIEKYFQHIKGPLAGRPMLLDPWQKFWTAVLYGWRKADGNRRFSRAYEEVSRKNGKSTWKGPQGAYLFIMDGEAGAEVYAVASTREQAMTVFKPAFENFKRWAKKSAGVARSFRIFEGTNQERIESGASVFKPIASNADAQDGFNPSAVLFDELHAQKSRDQWNVLESGFGARAQPLLSAITTAGFILDGVCTEIRSYLISVLEGTRATGSFLTSGLKIGQVVRLTAGTFNAANLNKNLFIVGLTALEATVIVLNGSALVAEGPIATATITIPGKTTYIPTTGHTDKSFSIEEWYSDIARSEVFSGCKFTKASVQLPPSGMATLGLDVAGKDHGQVPGSTRYFTSPTALSSSGVVAAVNGVLRVGGVTMASVTGLNFDIDASFTGDPVVGANVVPTQFAGRVKVSGQFTAYFEDGVIPSAFFDETELGIQVALTTSNDAAAEFVSFSLSRVKLGGADKADSDGGVVRTYPFTALLNSAGGSGTAHEQSTIAIQDSLA